MSSGRESCSPRLIGDRLLRDRRDEKRASIRMRNCRRMPTKGGGSPTEVANLATGAAPQEAVFSGGRGRPDRKPVLHADEETAACPGATSPIARRGCTCVSA